MDSLRTSFRASQLVMWSSPLLLLVLLFTLTNASSAPTTTSTQIASSSSTIERSTTRTAPATRTTVTPHERRITPPSPPLITTTTTTTTVVPLTVNSVNPYVATTSSTVKSIALAPNESASSGALGGTVNVTLPVVAIPLQGPGRWALSTSAPALEGLSCNGSNLVVTVLVTISNHQSCQLEITSIVPGVSLKWQLTPTH